MPKTILHLTSIENGGAATLSSELNNILNINSYSSFLLFRGKRVAYPDGSIHNVDISSKKILQKALRFLSRELFKYISLNKKYLCLNLYERFTCYSAKDIINAIPVIPDIIIVHWASDFVNAKIIHDLYHLTKAEIFLIMIDNAPITGGCHYPWNCEGYKTDCSNCPAINSKIARNWNKKNLSFKKLYYDNCKVNLIAASETDYNRAKSSFLFKNKSIKQLYFHVDEEKFKPTIDKKSILNEFSIVTDKIIIFLGSTHLDEKRKGMNTMIEAIKFITNKELYFVIAGNSMINLSPYESKYLGRLNEKELVKAYQIADIFICPSLEDSGPMMVLQSLMCGTPVIAFDQGYARGIIENLKNGYKAKLGDPLSLAVGIDLISSLTQIELNQMREKCREIAVELFSKTVFINNFQRIVEHDGTDNNSSIN